MHMPENSGGDFKPCPDGNHVAICIRVIDLGTQKVEYQGQTKMQHKVLITWEIPEEKMDDGRPFTINKKYTFSSHEKSNFRKDLEAWRGLPFKDSDFGPGGFDIKNLLDKGCMLNVVHNEKGGTTYANIASIARLPKGMATPIAHNGTVYFSLENPDWTVFDALSDGLKKTIMESPEYHEARQTNEDHGPESADDYGAHSSDEFEEVAF